MAPLISQLAREQHSCVQSVLSTRVVLSPPGNTFVSRVRRKPRSSGVVRWNTHWYTRERRNHLFCLGSLPILVVSVPNTLYHEDPQESRGYLPFIRFGKVPQWNAYIGESAEGSPVPCMISKVPASLTGMTSVLPVEKKMAEIGCRDE